MCLLLAFIGNSNERKNRDEIDDLMKLLKLTKQTYYKITWYIVNLREGALRYQFFFL
jgi:hypothetical protein